MPFGCGLPRSCILKIKNGRRSGDRGILLDDLHHLEEGHQEEGRALHLLHPVLPLAGSKDSALEAGDQAVAHQTRSGRPTPAPLGHIVHCDLERASGLRPRCEKLLGYFLPLLLQSKFQGKTLTLDLSVHLCL
jgi:hypothetical protein